MTFFGRRRLHTEHDLQKTVYQFLVAALPHDSFVTAIDHSGGGRLQQAMKQGRGVRAGLADIFIVYRGKLHCLELKRPDGKGVVSKDQRFVAERLHAAGVSTMLARNLDQVVDVLKIWQIPMRANVSGGDGK